MLLAVGPDSPAQLSALRALPGLWGSTPVLAVGAAETGEPLAVAGWIQPPWDAGTALATIEEWTGPLADLTLRDPADAAYRLLRLVGMTRATSMLGRFAGELDEALARLAAPGEQEELRSLAHRVAGIAGLYGFGELGQLWLPVESGESADLALVAAATRAVLARVAAWPNKGPRQGL